MASKTQKAVAYFLENEGEVTQMAVAAKFGLTKGALSRALKYKRENQKRMCPCCGQIIRDAFKGL